MNCKILQTPENIQIICRLPRPKTRTLRAYCVVFIHFCTYLLGKELVGSVISPQMEVEVAMVVEKKQLKVEYQMPVCFQVLKILDETVQMAMSFIVYCIRRNRWRFLTCFISIECL